MSLLDRTLAALSRRAGELLLLTEELVCINSHSKNVAGTDAVGELIRRSLADLPLQVRAVNGAPWGTHWCFSTRAANRSSAVLLIGHHDTVFPAGTFEGFRADGVHAHGPGVLDMKGGLAMVITALRCLNDAQLLDALPLRFVSVADEEVGSPTSRVLLQELAQKARCALVFESGRAGDAIVTSRRGSGFATVTAHGRAAHAGNAFKDGVNAIWALARFVDLAQRLNGTIPGTSVSTGLFHGGTARNTVAERAEAQLDLRFDDLHGQRALFAALETCANAAAAEVKGTRLEVRPEVTRTPLEPTSASRQLLERYAACQRTVGLGGSEAPRQGGGSDANTVAACGIPAIDGLGPRGRGYHTHDEHVEIASFVPKTQALLRFLLAEFGHSDAE